MEAEAGLEEALATLQLGSEADKDTLDPNPLNSSGEDPLAVFAEDEDLVAALLSIEDNNSSEQQIYDDNDQEGGLLPDIEVDFGDDDDEFLDPDQLGTVFDDTGEENIETQEEDNFQSRLKDIQDVDQETDQLYEDLAKLSLLGADEDPIPEGSDGLPPYLFCQPCAPESELFEPLIQRLPSITEDEPLSEQHIQIERQSVLPIDDLEGLLKLSMLNLDENDDLLQGMDPSGYDQSYEEQAQAYGGPAQVAVREAEPLLDAFGVTTSKSQERSCFGHKETIFGVTFSECGKFCATAGQDSTINVWDVEANSLLSSLKEHSKDFECLRVAWASPRWAMDALDRTKGDFCHLLATSGADGTVRLWGCSDPMKKDEWKCHVLLDHATFLGRSDKESSQEAKEEAKEEEGQKDDKPQVYSLQFIDHWKGFTSHQNSGRLNSFLMTSSDDYAHFWEVDVQPSEQSIHLEADKISLLADKIELKEVMSLHFASIEHYGYGVTACSITDSGLKLPSATSLQGDNNTFGGERNPDNVVFVFDAAYCDANGLFGAALSDGTLRLVNGRGVCISILNLPGCQSHLTSFCWDKTGTRLATSVATGHLITWHLDIDNVQGQGQGQTVATCSAIMEGGKTYLDSPSNRSDAHLGD